jgi:hypothetical protein
MEPEVKNMASIFETVILNMRETGMFQFLLPFMLSSAIFYGMLRKSKIFGEPREVLSVNAVVALVASFMVWASPILLGIDMEMYLASFFLQGISATLVILVGLLIVSMFFPPDLGVQLAKTLNTQRVVGGILIIGLLVGVGLLFSSGMINIFLPEELIGNIVSDDILISFVMVALLLGTALIIVWGGGEKPSSS